MPAELTLAELIASIKACGFSGRTIAGTLRLGTPAEYRQRLELMLEVAVRLKQLHGCDTAHIVHDFTRWRRHPYESTLQSNTRHRLRTAVLDQLEVLGA